MKPAKKILVLVAAAAVVAIIACPMWFLYDRRTQIFPETYRPWLVTDRAVYANIDSVAESDFQLYAYGFYRNKYVNAIPNARRTPNVANDNGDVPSFEIDDDIFIVTFKWVSRSSGLAISDSPNFAAKLEGLDEYVSVKHLDENIYTWNLHLNYTRHEANAR